MANPSNSVFLSCGDSGLSVTASVAGILTFAYAIAAGTLFYASIAKEAPKRRSRVEKAVKEAEFRLQRFARVGEEAQHTFLDGKEIEPEQHSRWMFLYHNWMAQYHHWMADLHTQIAVLIETAHLEEKAITWLNWWKFLRVSTASSKAKLIDAMIKELESISMKLDSMADDLESRVHDKERLEQNAILVKIWTELKDVKAEQDTTANHHTEARPSEDQATPKTRTYTLSTEDENMVTSLMRPRRAMAPLKSSTPSPRISTESSHQAATSPSSGKQGMWSAVKQRVALFPCVSGGSARRDAETNDGSLGLPAAI